MSYKEELVRIANELTDVAAQYEEASAPVISPNTTIKWFIAECKKHNLIWDGNPAPIKVQLQEILDNHINLEQVHKDTETAFKSLYVNNQKLKQTLAGLVALNPGVPSTAPTLFEDDVDQSDEDQEEEDF